MYSITTYFQPTFTITDQSSCFALVIPNIIAITRCAIENN